MGDGQLALAAIAFEKCSLLVFALLLRQPWVQQSHAVRYAAGVAVACVLLVGQPLIYFSPTQMHGLTCASFGCLSAWAILYLTFLEDPKTKPTILEVVLSPTRLSLEGVIRVHQRGRSTPAGKKAQQQQAAHQPGSLPLWSLMQEVAVTWLLCAVTYDVGNFVLCSLSGDMCLSSSSIAPSWMARCLFAFPAGILLTQQIEQHYCLIRMLMLLLAFKFPVLGHMAAQMPTRALNWPVLAASVGELWGARWHQFLRVYFEDLGGAAVNAVFPKDRAPSALRASMRCVAAFTLSGLLHEYILWAAFGAVTGWHMAFFMLNCAAVLAESWVPALLAACVPRKWLAPSGQTDSSQCAVTAHVTPRASGKAAGSAAAGKAGPARQAGISAPVWLKHAWTLSFFILLGPRFVEPCRAAGFFDERAYHPFGVPLVPAALGLFAQAS